MVAALLSLLASAALAETATPRETSDRLPRARSEQAAQSAQDNAVEASAVVAAAPCSDRQAPGACAVQPARYELNLRRDWSSVGPSLDDFAPIEEGLRLRGARVVGRFRF